MTGNLAQSLFRHSQARPHATAVVCGTSKLGYYEMAARASRIARALMSLPNWRDEGSNTPRVGILASRSIDACVAMSAACWAGATYVPIGLKLPEERILTLLSLCDLSALIVDAEGAKRLSLRVLAACPPCLIQTGETPAQADDDQPYGMEATLPACVPYPPQSMGGEETAYIIFTSGTTGVPKGVMIPLAAARHYVRTICAMLGLLPTDRALETCELSFDFSVHNMFATWEAGAALHILPAARVMNAVKFARESQLTVWHSVPSLAGMLRQITALGPNSLPGLRVTVFGGEALPSATARAWQAAAPNSRIYNLYGPTEATVFCLAQEVGDPLPETPGRGVVAIGLPLPGCEAAVFDASGQALGPDTPGELAIAGVQLASGYLNEPELTARRFPSYARQRWYLTGDQAIEDAAGVFHCLGRIDNQIKVMGYRVELEEIDAQLREVSHADVVGSIAWPVVEGMACGIVSFVHASAIDAERLLNDLKARVPAYMLPTRIVALDSMPLNANGKVDRRALARLLESTQT